MAMRRLTGRSGMTPGTSSNIQYLPDLATLALKALPNAIMKVTVNMESSLRTRRGRPYAKAFSLASVSPGASMIWFALVIATLGINATFALATIQHVSATGQDQDPRRQQELIVAAEVIAVGSREVAVPGAVEHVGCVHRGARRESKILLVTVVTISRPAQCLQLEVSAAWMQVRIHMVIMVYLMSSHLAHLVWGFMLRAALGRW